MLSTDTDTLKTKHTQLHAMIRTHNFEPNVKFDFDVSASNCMLSDTSKSNSTLCTFGGICQITWSRVRILLSQLTI